MKALEELSQIKRELVPWLKHWDLLGENDQPDPPPAGIVERLGKLIAENPNYEPALRESLTVHLLLNNRIIAIGLLKRIIDLPGKRKPKLVARDKTQLANLLKNTDVECDAFLQKVELKRDQFLALGRFVEEVSDNNEAVNLTNYTVTTRWAKVILNADEEEARKLSRRLFDAGAFNDFGVREIYFEMTPHL